MTARWLSLVLVLVALPVAAAPPRDDATEKARALFTHAEALYTLQNYKDALAEYERAYEIKPLPGFLFNIAQCHRQLGNYERAAHFYQAYLDKNPKAPNRETAVALMAEMRARAEAGGQKGVIGKNVGSQGSGNNSNNPSLTLNPNNGVNGQNNGITDPPPGGPGPADDKPIYKKWWLWTIVGGVVVAGVATGVGIAAAGGGAPDSTLGVIDVR